MFELPRIICHSIMMKIEARLVNFYVKRGNDSSADNHYSKFKANYIEYQKLYQRINGRESSKATKLYKDVTLFLDSGGWRLGVD